MLKNTIFKIGMTECQQLLAKVASIVEVIIVGNSNAGRWAARWAQPRNFQTKLDIRSSNIDAAKNAEVSLKSAHEGAVYTAFPTGDGLDMRNKNKYGPEVEITTYHDGEDVRSWHAGDK